MDCSQNEDVCDRHGFCIASLKMCICETGYAGDGLSCFDINECEAAENPCKNRKGSEKCVNIDGGYICCDSEMEDEQCIEEKGAYCSGGCGLHAVCFNQTCTCADGFEGDPKTRCNDVNECENESICPGVGQWCVNMLGGYICCGRDSIQPECKGLEINALDGQITFGKSSSGSLQTVLGKKVKFTRMQLTSDSEIERHFSEIIEKGQKQDNASGGVIVVGRGWGNGSDASGEAISSNGIVFSFENPGCDSALQNTSCPEFSKCLNGKYVDECVQLPPPCSEGVDTWCVNNVGGYQCCTKTSSETECLGLEIVPLDVQTGEGGLRSSEIATEKHSTSKWITESFGKWKNESAGQIFIKKGKIEASFFGTTPEPLSPEFGLEIVAERPENLETTMSQETTESYLTTIQSSISSSVTASGSIGSDEGENLSLLSSTTKILESTTAPKQEINQGLTTINETTLLSSNATTSSPITTEPTREVATTTKPTDDESVEIVAAVTMISLNTTVKPETTISSETLETRSTTQNVETSSVSEKNQLTKNESLLVRGSPEVPEDAGMEIMAAVTMVSPIASSVEPKGMQSTTIDLDKMKIHMTFVPHNPKSTTLAPSQTNATETLLSTVSLTKIVPTISIMNVTEEIQSTLGWTGSTEKIQSSTSETVTTTLIPNLPEMATTVVMLTTGLHNQTTLTSKTISPESTTFGSTIAVPSEETVIINTQGSTTPSTKLIESTTLPVKETTFVETTFGVTSTSSKLETTSSTSQIGTNATTENETMRTPINEFDQFTTLAPNKSPSSSSTKFETQTEINTGSPMTPNLETTSMNPVKTTVLMEKITTSTTSKSSSSLITTTVQSMTVSQQESTTVQPTIFVTTVVPPEFTTNVFATATQSTTGSATSISGITLEGFTTKPDGITGKFSDLTDVTKSEEIMSSQEKGLEISVVATDGESASKKENLTEVPEMGLEISVVGSKTIGSETTTIPVSIRTGTPETIIENPEDGENLTVEEIERLKKLQNQTTVEPTSTVPLSATTTETAKTSTSNESSTVGATESTTSTKGMVGLEISGKGLSTTVGPTEEAEITSTTEGVGLELTGGRLPAKSREEFPKSGEVGLEIGPELAQTETTTSESERTTVQNVELSTTESVTLPEAIQSTTKEVELSVPTTEAEITAAVTFESPASKSSTTPLPSNTTEQQTESSMPKAVSSTESLSTKTQTTETFSTSVNTSPSTIASETTTLPFTTSEIQSTETQSTEASTTPVITVQSTVVFESTTMSPTTNPTLSTESETTEASTTPIITVQSTTAIESTTLSPTSPTPSTETQVTEASTTSIATSESITSAETPRSSSVTETTLAQSSQTSTVETIVSTEATVTKGPITTEEVSSTVVFTTSTQTTFVSTTEQQTTVELASSTHLFPITATSEPETTTSSTPTEILGGPLKVQPSTSESSTATIPQNTESTTTVGPPSPPPPKSIEEFQHVKLGSKEQETQQTTEATEATEQTSTISSELMTAKPSTKKCLSNNDCQIDAYCERRSGVCRCKSGFRDSGSSCQDIDECKEKLDDCHVSSRCVNYRGNYECVCAIGYRKNSVGDCEDIDECKESNGTLCHKNAQCRNLPGAYLCECNPGFTGDGYTCIELGKRHCNQNEWTKSDCGRNHLCLVDSQGKIDCDTCKSGFIMKHGICSDVNECESSSTNSCHSDAICHNIMGTYICHCQPGYAGDGKYCQDIDECTQNNPCHPQATCINSPGSFTCRCPDGWTGNGITACLNPADQACSNAKCSSAGNSSLCLAVQIADKMADVCECQANYRYNSLIGQCEDIDECLEDRNNCDVATTICVNKPGGFTCKCASGYEGTSGICTDIDECERGIAGCHVNAHCINRIGGVECRCGAGYSGDGTNCLLMDERQNVVSDCNPDWIQMCRSLNKTCHIDDEEVPQCGSCMFGFQPMDGKCLPINALGNCADPLKNDCDKNAECIDVRPGRHFCSCKIGYIGDGMHCDDVDECSIPRLCDNHAICRNTNGSYECHCRDGYTGNGFKCVPANQSQNCRINPQICHSNAGCQPDGTCRCLRNFEGDGVHKCEMTTTDSTGYDFETTSTTRKLTESTENPFLTSTPNAQRCSEFDRTACHVLATCDLAVGQCVCRQGFMGDGYIACTRIWEDCTIDPTMCHSSGYCNFDTKQCQCALGYIGDGITCVPDKMDCIIRSNLCNEFAQCVARRCVCGPGYTGDGSTCVPLEPPKELVGNCSTCHSHASCNTQNTCKCNNGCFGNGWICVLDPEDCINYPGVCHMNGFCNKTTRHCACKKGFTGNGLDCSKRISCHKDPTICHSEAKCLSDGRCECNEGLIGDGVECHKAITASEIFGTSAPQLVHFECPSECGKNSECINGACKCQLGYISNDNSECVDIDECKMGTSSCHPFANCINRDGTYDCQCREGYVGNGRSCQQSSQNIPQGNDVINVECLDDGMKVILVEETKAFNGRVFVRGQSSNPFCTKTFDGKGSNDSPPFFHIPLAHCDMQLEANDTLAVTVIVQKHPMFVTELAYAYRLRCTYLTDTKMIMSHVNVTDITTAGTLESKGLQPFCQLTVTNEKDTTVDNAIVGQLLKLVIFVVPNNSMPIMPRNCFAINLDDGNRYPLTNDAGCAVEPQLFPEWKRVNSYSLEAAFRTFKWPDSSMIRFECDCAACVDGCPEPNCQNQKLTTKSRIARDEGAVTDAPEFDEISSKIIWLKNGKTGKKSAYSSVVLVTEDSEEQIAQKQMENWLATGGIDEPNFFSNLDEERICVGTQWAGLSLLSVIVAVSLLIAMTLIYNRRVRRSRIINNPSQLSSNASDAGSAYIKF
uniref:Uncharacterized protein n=1 Tax=Panagrolaimus sp. JU765 TaxID=591449 RepID=A0AC34Q6P6_9BILA